MLFWDASGLIKRYTAEAGGDTVDALMAAVPTSRMVATYWGYAETYSSLLRKRNRGDLTAAAFSSAVSLLQVEVLDDPDWILLPIEDGAVLAGIRLMNRYNINSTDAALLATYLDYIGTLSPGGPTPLLVAADARLLRAAAAEGLATLNPEAVAAADVPAHLASP